MTQITSEKIYELIEKSRLIEPAALTERLEEIRTEHGGSLPEDPVELCKELEKKGLLTRWHCEKLLQGKYKGFFLGKHKLLGHIGSGGMSSVYLAEHQVMKHKRAIKVLPKKKLGKTSYLERFQREAKAIASLNHPNVVRAYDIDNDRDTHYMVMEFVEGADFQQLVRKHGPMPYAIVADYMAQAAHGLQHAHDAGLIHRDVKPANILVDKDGIVKVLDLGLALFVEETDASLTMEYNDKVLGTADYLAPEQAINSHKVDSRADIYGLGCTMYFLLTGHAPFPDGSIASRIIKHQSTMPAEIRKDRPDCPGELDGICVKMMQKDARFRYQTCNQIAEVLETWLEKYRKENPDITIKPSKGMSIDDLLTVSKTKSAANTDTVNNRSGKTLTGKNPAGSAFINLSSSDSGVLRSIARSDASSVDSHIDLIHDSNQPNSKKTKSQAIANATRDLDPKSSAGKSSPSALARPIATKNTASTTTTTNATATTTATAPAVPIRKPPVKKSNANYWLLGVAGVIVVILFILILFASISAR